MHALAALILLTAVNASVVAVRYSAKYNASTLHAASKTSNPVDDLTVEALQSLDEREGVRWPRRVVRCARQFGLSRCLKGFAVCRAERAAEALESGVGLHFNIRDELNEFPWEQFSNATEEQLDARLLELTRRVFEGRALTLAYTGGVLLDVDSQRNGSLRIDIKKDRSAEYNLSLGRGRGTRWRKRFYRIVPFLLIPPLIMAAILPFKLPAFMMLTMGAVLINNMALTGSLFTLLRNNAFDDNYEKKVIYVNDGYKNEETMPIAEGAFTEGVLPDGSLISDEHFVQGGFHETHLPKESFPFEGFQVESFPGETFFPNDIKAKKRRGHKQKRKRKPAQENEGGESDWTSQDELYNLPEDEDADDGGLHQFHDSHSSNFHSVIGGRGAGGKLAGVVPSSELLDYTNSNIKSLKPTTNT